MAEKYQRRWQAAFGLVEMVLRHPGRIKALGLGVDDLLGDQAVALGSAGLVEQAAEKAQALRR